MNFRSKTLLLALCAVLLAAGTVFGTFAYFTDSDAVTNTFSVGSVGLTLDEADVKPDGTLNSDNRVHKNTYHLLPGHTYIKDPTVTVTEGSSDAYIRMMVQVENLRNLKAALTDAKYYDGDVFLLQNLCLDKDGSQTWDGTKWLFETFHVDGPYAGCYEFRYHTTVNSGKLEPLFTHITVPGEIDNADLVLLKDVQIIVTAHAMQAQGFENAAAAWAAFGEQQN